MLYFKSIKINAIVNKVLLARDKFMPEMHLQDLHIVRVDDSLKIKKK